ncbi:MAG TPA: efflux RND transporter periplasmic adaptor subunit [Xenococcaceae cyanobacterium]
MKNKAFIVFLLFITASCGKQPAVSVEVQTLDINNIQLSSEFLGRLEAKEKSTLAPIVDSRIIEIAVQEGGAIEQGDLVARIQPSQDSATNNQDLNRITAPIDGIIGNIEPNVGDFIGIGEPITTITQNSVLEINMSVPLEQTDRLELGLPVEIIDRQGEAIAEGDISFISPSANRSTQTILVKAVFKNNGTLKDGSFARARIIWSEQLGILIPTQAVSRIAGKSFVYVAKEQEDGKKALVAEQRSVKLGAIQGRSYQVISGLKSGDLLITSGILNLTNGTPIDLGE